MSYSSDLWARQAAELDRALDQYHWRLCHDSTEPWPGYDLTEDTVADEQPDIPAEPSEEGSGAE